MHFGRRMGKFLLFTEGLPDSTVCFIAASRRVALGLGFSSIYSFHFVDFGRGGVRSAGCWISAPPLRLEEFRYEEAQIYYVAVNGFR